MKAGTHSVFGEESHTRAYTPKQGAFRMGMVSLPSDRFARFGNPKRPGVRTANFAVLGPWSAVLPESTESLWNSDALMRVAVPRRRGPAGLRDSFFAPVEITVCTSCAQGLLCMRGETLPSVCSMCCRNARCPLVKRATAYLDDLIP